MRGIRALLNGTAQIAQELSSPNEKDIRQPIRMQDYTVWMILLIFSVSWNFSLQDSNTIFVLTSTAPISTIKSSIVSSTLSLSEKVPISTIESSIVSSTLLTTDKVPISTIKSSIVSSTLSLSEKVPISTIESSIVSSTLSTTDKVPISTIESSIVSSTLSTTDKVPISTVESSIVSSTLLTSEKVPISTIKSSIVSSTLSLSEKVPISTIESSIVSSTLLTSEKVPISTIESSIVSSTLSTTDKVPISTVESSIVSSTLLTSEKVPISTIKSSIVSSTLSLSEKVPISTIESSIVSSTLLTSEKVPISTIESSIVSSTLLTSEKVPISTIESSIVSSTLSTTDKVPISTIESSIVSSTLSTTDKVPISTIESSIVSSTLLTSEKVPISTIESSIVSSTLLTSEKVPISTIESSIVSSTLLTSEKVPISTIESSIVSSTLLTSEKVPISTIESSIVSSTLLTSEKVPISTIESSIVSSTLSTTDKVPISTIESSIVSSTLSTTDKVPISTIESSIVSSTLLTSEKVPISTIESSIVSSTLLTSEKVPISTIESSIVSSTLSTSEKVPISTIESSIVSSTLLTSEKVPISTIESSIVSSTLLTSEKVPISTIESSIVSSTLLTSEKVPISTIKSSIVSSTLSLSEKVPISTIESSIVSSTLLTSEKVPISTIESSIVSSTLLTSEKVPISTIESSIVSSTLLTSEKVPISTIKSSIVSSTLSLSEKVPISTIESSIVSSTLLTSEKVPISTIESSIVSSTLSLSEKVPISTIKSSIVSSTLLNSEKVPISTIESSIVSSTLLTSEKVPISTIESSIVSSTLSTTDKVPISTIESSIVSSTLLTSEKVPISTIESSIVSSTLLTSEKVPISTIESSIVSSTLSTSEKVPISTIESSIVSSTLLTSEKVPISTIKSSIVSSTLSLSEKVPISTIESSIVSSTLLTSEKVPISTIESSIVSSTLLTSEKVPISTIKSSIVSSTLSLSEKVPISTIESSIVSSTLLTSEKVPISTIESSIVSSTLLTSEKVPISTIESSIVSSTLLTSEKVPISTIESSIVSSTLSLSEKVPISTIESSIVSSTLLTSEKVPISTIKSSIVSSTLLTSEKVPISTIESSIVSSTLLTSEKVPISTIESSIVSSTLLTSEKDSNMTHVPTPTVLISTVESFTVSPTSLTSKGVPPSITVSPVSQEVVYQNSAVLNCTSSGNPIPNITWSFGNKNLNVEAKYNITIVGNVNTLVVKNLNRYDNGSYVCFAINENGNDTNSSNLIVLSPPDPPIELMSTERTASSIKISWKESPFNGNSPVTNFTVILEKENKTYNCPISNSTHTPVCNISSTNSTITQIPVANFTILIKQENQTNSCSISNVTHGSVCIVSSKNVTFTQLTPHTNYSFTVCSNNIIGQNCTDGNFKVLTLQDAPSEPQMLSVVDKTSDSFLISWIEPGMLNGVITFYNLTLCLLVDGNGRTYDNCVMSYTVVLAKNYRSFNTSRNFTLCSYCKYQIELRAATVRLGPPAIIQNRTLESASSKPRNVSLVPISSTALNVSWLPPLNKNGRLSGYFITWRILRNDTNHSVVGQTMSENLENDTSSFEISKLEHYSVYEVTINAVNGFGNGSRVVVMARTNEHVPSAPVAVNVTALSSTQLKVTWFPPLDPNGVITGYNITWKLKNDDSNDGVESVLNVLSTPLNSSSRSYVIDSLKPYSVYTVIVYAITGAGSGDGTSIDKQTGESTPSEPTNVRLDLESSTGLLLNWSPPTNPNGEITGYRIISFIVKDDKNRSVNINKHRQDIVTETGFEMEHLEPYFEYNVSLNAITIAGNGTQVFRLVRTSQSIPSEPLNVKASNISSTQLNVSWDEPKKFNGILVSYTVYYKFLRDDNNEVVHGASYESRNTSPDVRTLTLTNLEKYSVYEVKVSASTSVGEGRNSAVKEFLTDEDTPGAPINVTLQRSSSTVLSLTWVIPSDPNGIIRGYNVSWSKVLNDKNGTVPMNRNSTNTTNTSFLISNLDPYSVYNVSLNAFTIVGSGEVVNSTKRTDEAVPSEPRNVRASNISSTQLNVSWDEPEKFNGVLLSYTVYYKLIRDDKNNVVHRTSYESRNIYSDVRTLILEELDKYSVYKVKVSASTSVGEGMNSTVKEFLTDEDTPGAPVNLTLQRSSSTVLELTWVVPMDPNGVILGYYVSWSKVMNDKNETVPIIKNSTNTTKTSFSISNLDPYSVYNVSLNAFTFVGNGEAVNLSERTGEAVPSEPRNVRASNVSSTQLNVSWDEPEKFSGILLSYTVYYKLIRNDNNKVLQRMNYKSTNTSPDVRTLTLTNGEKYSVYEVKVSASTSVGEGMNSTVKEFLTDEDTPGAPVNVTLERSSFTVLKLTWVVPMDPNGVILGYYVSWIKVVNDKNETVPIEKNDINTTKTSFSISNLDPYSVYNVSLNAFTIVGNGEVVNINERTDEAVPSEPRNVRASNVSSTQLNVSWDEPENFNGVLLSYTVYYKLIRDDNNEVVHSMIYKSTNTSTDVRTLTLTNLEKYSVYEVKVSASTSVGEGMNSTVKEFLTDEDTPGAPVNVTLEISSSTVLELTWVVPMDPNGIIRGYNVSWSKVINDRNETVPITMNSTTTTKTSFSISNLDPYSVYNVSLNAFTFVGNGEAVDLSERTGETVPSEPRNVRALNVSSTQLNVSWDEPEKFNGVLLSYTVYYKPIRDDNNKVVHRMNYKSTNTLTDVRTLTLTYLEKYSVYEVKVSASTSVGEGMNSTVKEFLTDEDTPGPPVNVTLQRSSSTVLNLTWEIPRDPNGIIRGYNVSWSKVLNDKNETVPMNRNSTNTTNTSFSISNLDPYSIYNVSLNAFTSVGNGEVVDLSERTGETVPSEPRNLRASNRSSIELIVSWDEPENFNGILRSYTVYYKRIRDDNDEVVHSMNYESRNTLPDVRTLNLTNLEKYSVYEVKVSASTVIGEGRNSTVKEFLTNEDTPGPPVNVTLQRSSSTVLNLTWEIPRDPNGIIRGYYVSWSKVLNDKNETVPMNRNSTNTTNTSFSISNLDPYSIYNVSLNAFTSVGNGEVVDLSERTGETVPSEPRNLRASNRSSIELIVSWDEPENFNGILRSYTVYYKRIRDDNNEVVYSMNYESRNTLPDVRTLNLTYLEKYSVYEVKVSASTVIGEGRNSTVKEFLTDEDTPGPLVNVTLQRSSSTVLNLTWEIPRDPNGIIRGYYVSWSKVLNDKNETVPMNRNSTNTTNTSFSISNLDPYSIYNVSLNAFTLVGNGEVVDLSERTGETVPSEPRNLRASNRSSIELIVSWDEPENFNGILRSYTVYYKRIRDDNNEIVDSMNYESRNTLPDVRTLNLTNLEKYSVYEVKVSASTVIGEGRNSTVKEFLTNEDTPGAPVNVTLQRSSSTVLNLTWEIPRDPNGIIRGYYVSWSKVLNDKNETVPMNRNSTNTTNTSFSISNLDPYSIYNVSLNAFTSVGNGEVVDLSERTGETVPSEPRNLRASNRSSIELIVSWDEPENFNGILRSYTVYYKRIRDDNNEIVDSMNYESRNTLPDVRTLNLTNLEKYSVYEVKVSASTVIGEGRNSTVKEFLTNEDTPGAPVNVTLQRSSSTVLNLTWEIPSDPNGIIRGYNISWSKVLNDKNETVPMNRNSTNTTNTSFSISNLDPYSIYNVSLNAFTSVGNGEVVDLSERTGETVPSKPRNLRASNRSSIELIVSWDEPENFNGILLSYTVYYNFIRDDKNNVVPGTSYESRNTLPYVRTLSLTYLEKYSVYEVKVSASTVIGEGRNSTVKELLTDEDTPGAPVNVTLQRSSSTVLNLTWEIPSDPNGIILGYYVSWSKVLNDKNETVLMNRNSTNTTNTSFSISNLDPYSIYNVSLNAFTFVGNGEAVDLSERTGEAVPSEPRNVRALNVSSTQLNVSWDEPEKFNGILLSYTVYYKRIRDDNNEVVHSMNYESTNTLPDVRTLNLTNLKKYSVYEVKVSASTVIGEGRNSTVKEFLTDEDTPGPPVNVTLQRSSSTVLNLTWEIPSDPNGIIRGYNISWSKVLNDKNETVPMNRNSTNTTNTSFSISNLDPYSIYNVSLNAFTFVGNGEAVDLSERTGEAVPSEPRNVRALNVSSTQLNVSWDEPEKFNGILLSYTVYYKRIRDDNNEVVHSMNYESTNTLPDVRTLNLTNLKKYSVYEVKVSASTVIGEGRNSTVNEFLTDEDTPGPPVNVTLQRSSSTVLNLTWEIPSDPNGIIRGYNISWSKVLNDKNETVPMNRNSTNTTNTSFSISNLDPYSIYNVSLNAFTFVGNGEVVDLSERTGETAPSEPQMLIVVDKTSDSFLISWIEPGMLNGVVTFYNLTLCLLVDGNGRTYDNCVISYTVVLAKNDRSFNTSRNFTLCSYCKYQIELRAATVRLGPPAIIQNRTLESAASKPRNVSLVPISSTALNVSWLPPLNKNGRLSGYFITWRILRNDTNHSVVGQTMSESLENDTSSFEISKLEHHSVYEVTINAVNGFGNGSRVVVMARTNEHVPSVPDNVNVIAPSSTMLQVTWFPPLDPNGVITGYNITWKLIEDDNNNAVESVLNVLSTPLNPSSRSYVINSLEHYSLYNVTVYAITDAGAGSGASVEQRTGESIPGIPSNVACGTSAKKSLNVSWKEPLDPNGKVRLYKLTWMKLRNRNAYESIAFGENKSYTTPNTIEADIGNNSLEPFTVYRVSVAAQTLESLGFGREQNISCNTSEDVPNAPPELTSAYHLGPYSARVTWEPLNNLSWQAASIQYVVTYQLLGDNNRLTVESDVLQVNLNGLNPNSSYTVTVLARNRVGDGAKSNQMEFMTNLTIPPDITSTTIPFTLEEYQDENVSIYQIIVLEVIENLRLPDTDIIVTRYYFNRTAGEPYITAEFPSSEFNKYKDFVVGQGNSFTNAKRRKKRAASINIVNGALTEGRLYRLLQRGLDDKRTVIKTRAWTDTIETIKKIDDDDDSYVGVIVGVVVAAVILVILIVIAVFYIRRRGGNNRKQFKDDIELDNRGYVPGEVFAVTDFSEHCRRLAADSNCLYSLEYSQIPRKNATLSMNAAELEANRESNRYNNILCYDENRVFLKTDPSGNDYINASYLDGCEKEKAYIATQGPLETTCEQFWRMVWENLSSIIVMVTGLEEGRKVKCHQYWPSKGSAEYGEFVVTLLEEFELTDYTIRTFKVVGADKLQERSIKQFHYTAWPDHGVPSSPSSLLNFVRKSSAANPPNAGPMVVHCSAGVGRTGTYVVIDTQLRRIAKRKTVDVYGNVQTLRNQRLLMVQVEDQYIFIHNVLLEAINNGETEIPVEDFPETLKEIMSVNPETGVVRVEEEFQRLGRSVSPPAQFKTANLNCNKQKNRYANVLPFDDSRVKLTQIPGIEGSDYINANFIDGYMKKKAFIATQAPIPDTIPDFWRMIWQENSLTIVMLSNEMESGRVKVHRYWPNKAPAVIGDLMVELMSEQTFDEYILRELKLTNTKEKASHVIRQFHYTSWPDVGSPSSGAGMMDLIGQVQRWQLQSGNKIITVHCSAGVGRTGVFCALSNLIERLKTEHVIDVFQTVKMLRQKRTAMVQTKDQYEFCYNVLIEYLDSFDLYANFT
ncbi:titin-like isoform X3 [Xenia sp. Carnegie-2017]|uniref:titin-like isoform X3 n=1 Tax=Xenia sp. Carnegie-2017 TaxID=2897299 RepID=UPI001F03536D|nr:titin-like isoform X3 [Xenia sp. Carnegie-2017]